MAATVVSVVIFLCGVLVGRGVKAERATLTSDGGASQALPDASPLPPPAPAQAAAATVDPAASAPPAVQEDKFSYPNRLEDQPRKETLKPAASTPPHAPVSVPKAAAAAVAPKEPREPKPEAKPEPKAPAPPPAAAAATHGDGYAIQVAALREPARPTRSPSGSSSKGYDAYVLTPRRHAERLSRAGRLVQDPPGRRGRPPRSCNRKNSSNPGSLADAIDRLHAGGSRLPARRVRPYSVRTVNRRSSSPPSFRRTPSGTRT